MAIPNQITDGSFTTAVQNGPATWRRPFQDRGDTISFEYLAMFQQDQASYLPTNNSLNLVTGYEVAQSISTARGLAYLVEETEPRHVGSGILEFQRTYASLPRTRYEEGTVGYTQQYYDFTPAIETAVYTLNARIKYEYFLTRPSVLYARKVAIFFDTLYFIGDWTSATAGTEVVDGIEFLGEDSETTVYRGIFFQRKSILVTVNYTEYV